MRVISREGEREGLFEMFYFKLQFFSPCPFSLVSIVTGFMYLIDAVIRAAGMASVVPQDVLRYIILK